MNAEQRNSVKYAENRVTLPTNADSMLLREMHFCFWLFQVIGLLLIMIIVPEVDFAVLMSPPQFASLYTLMCLSLFLENVIA